MRISTALQQKRGDLTLVQLFNKLEEMQGTIDDNETTVRLLKDQIIEQEKKLQRYSSKSQ